MAEKNRKFISLIVISLTAVFCVAFFLTRVWYLKKNGVIVHYLAELWAPSSVLSIVIVTFVEKLTIQPVQAAKKRKK